MKKTKSDTTQQRRQSKRMSQLNQIAQAKGWKGVSEYMTAILRGEIEIQSPKVIK